MKLAIAATFTAEPLQPLMKFWFDKLELDFSAEFAPYNQIFQQLLDPESLLSANKNGINLLIIRIEDWVLDQQSNVNSRYEFDSDKIDGLIEEFSDALMTECGRNQVPHLLVLAPPSNLIRKNTSYEFDHSAIAAQLHPKIESLKNLTLITPSEIDNLYHPDTIHDAFADKLGAIPYTEEYFAAMSATIARKIHRLKRSPFKVAVCDCDNTLWDGIVGEDGPLGIQFSEGRRELQRRLVEQKNAGMLVCLSSKNIVEDVEEIFRTRKEMPLRRGDLTALRINWQDKFLNLQSLADELNLGLDSFIFLDDNPVEIASVKSYFPQVLTLLIPEDPGLIPDTLSHFWAFDTANVTEEDKKRTELYRQNLRREEFKRTSMDLQSFIEGLALVVDIGPMTPAQVPRVAQLTQRTNQFNATTIRRNEAEIMNFDKDESNGILTASVRDRFGDYGLVGVIFYTVADETLNVDTLLLSCRVLGKGVEHRLIAKLGEVANKISLKTIVLTYTPSRRNEVIKNFFKSLITDIKEKTRGSLEYHILTSAACGTKYVPEIKNVAENRLAGEAEDDLYETLQSFTRRNEIILDVASNLRTPQEIIQACSKFHHVKRRDDLGTFIAPGTPFEEALAKIWRDLLKTDKVGIQDSFYELGGHSLLATMCLSRIRQRFAVSLSFEDFFAAPTIEALATIIVEKSSNALKEGELEDLLTELEGLSDDLVEEQLAEYANETAVFEKVAPVAEDMSIEIQNRVDQDSAVTDYRVFPAGSDHVLLYREGSTAAIVTDGSNFYCSTALGNETLRKELAVKIQDVSREAKRKISTPSTILNGIEATNAEKARQIITDWMDRGFEIPRSESKIEHLGILTKNRVDALEKCVRSYGEHAMRFGRGMEIAVFDDSQDPKINSRVRSLLLDLKNRFGFNLFYAGHKEKRSFAQIITREGDIPLNITDFAFAYDHPEIFSAGNRNSTLLHFVGNTYFCADDDTICDVYEPQNKSDGIKLTSNFDSQEYQVYPTFEVAQHGARLSDSDLIAAHEKLLGKNFIDPVLQAARQDRIIYEEMDNGLLDRLETRDGKIRAVINGIVGDCGWQTPFSHWGLELGYLTFRGSSRDRLMASKESYGLAFKSRHQVRFTEIPRISPRILLITTAASFDHCEILPPFFPQFRGGDIAYECILRNTIPNAMFGQVTPMIIHSPAERRVLFSGEVRRSASAFSMNKLIMECAAAAPELPATSTIEERILRLGEFLIQVSNMSLNRYEDFVWQRVLETNSEFILKMETLLNIYNESPQFWADDVKTYLSILRQALTLREYIAPQELLESMDYKRAQERTRQLLRKFGELLYWWPKIVETSLRLKDQNIGMGVPV